MKQAKINLYLFAELSESAKERAIAEHGEFLDSIGEEYENEAGEMVTEYPEHTTSDIIESIEANDYVYFADGFMASCVTYTGNQPKAGITELKLHGEIYSI